MPKIRGDTTHAHPILVLLASIFGVIVAVPALAVLKVLFDCGHSVQRRRGVSSKRHVATVSKLCTC